MTQAQSKSYGGVKKKLMGAVCMLLVASIMMVSSTYAWFTLSTAPEITGISTSVGANGNRTLGSGAVGGMLVGTLALLFIVPVLFVAFQWLQEKIRPMQFERAGEWSIRAEMEDLQNRKEEK